jgi:hypothetical protein
MGVPHLPKHPFCENIPHRPTPTLYLVFSFKLREDLVELQRSYPDIAWTQAFFDFETTGGIASGVFLLVPLADASWKAHTVFTNLENLKDSRAE